MLAACATLHLPDYPVNSFQSYSSRTTSQGVALAVKPFLEPKELESYFGTDLRSAGILPVFMLFENRGNSTVLVSKDSVTLVSTSGAHLGTANLSTSESLASTLGGIAIAIGSIPMMLASAKIGSDAKEITHNLAVKELRTKTLAPSAVTSGFLYFAISENNGDLEHLHVKASIAGIPDGNIQIIELALIAKGE